MKLKFVIVVIGSCYSITLISAANCTTPSVLFPLIHQTQATKNINEQDLQRAMTLLANTIDQTKITLHDLAQVVHEYSQKDRVSAPCVDMWSLQLKNKSLVMYDIIKELQSIASEMDECSFKANNNTCDARPVEHTEQEGAIIQKMMTKFFEEIAHADTAAYWLDAWTAFLESKAARGEPVTIRLPLWTRQMHQKEMTINELKAYVHKLIERIQKISLLIDKSQTKSGSVCS